MLMLMLTKGRYCCSRYAESVLDKKEQQQKGSPPLDVQEHFHDDYSHSVALNCDSNSLDMILPRRSGKEVKNGKYTKGREINVVHLSFRQKNINNFNFNIIHIFSRF